MKERLLERHHFVTFLILVAAGVVLTTVGVKAPYRVTPLEEVGLALTSPLARAGAGLTQGVADAWAGVTAFRTAHAELAAARREIRDLRLVLLDRQELSAENERLRELLDLRDRVSPLAVPARVVRQEIAPDRVLVLNRGRRHGITEDRPVIAPGGVVGKVLSATATAAKVQCLSDPDAAAAVLVGEQRRQVDAIVRDAAGGLLRLRHLDLMARPEPGEQVVTSGLDQVYPKGLPLGTVESVSDAGALELEVLVRPAVDFSRLEEVLVLVPPSERAAAQVRAARGEP